MNNWAVEPCCEYEWNEDAPIGRYPVRFIRCNGVAAELAAALEECIAQNASLSQVIGAKRTFTRTEREIVLDLLSSDTWTDARVALAAYRTTQEAPTS